MSTLLLEKKDDPLIESFVRCNTSLRTVNFFHIFCCQNKKPSCGKKTNCISDHEKSTELSRRVWRIRHWEQGRIRLVNHGNVTVRKRSQGRRRNGRKVNGEGIKAAIISGWLSGHQNGDTVASGSFKWPLNPHTGYNLNLY